MAPQWAGDDGLQVAYSTGNVHMMFGNGAVGRDIVLDRSDMAPRCDEIRNGDGGCLLGEGYGAGDVVMTSGMGPHWTRM